MVRARAAVPTFHPDLPSTMGAVAEALRTTPGARRSRHPQVSVAAIGARAGEVVARQSLAYAVGPVSPFATMRALEAKILFLGVGHNRNTFLHHAESLVPHHRTKIRRFPHLVDGERVWVEVTDVADDLDTWFPVVGADFERATSVRVAEVNGAPCRLLPAAPLVDFAVDRLAELLPAADPEQASGPGPARRGRGLSRG